MKGFRPSSRGGSCYLLRVSRFFWHSVLFIPRRTATQRRAATLILDGNNDHNDRDGDDGSSGDDGGDDGGGGGKGLRGFQGSAVRGEAGVERVWRRAEAMERKRAAQLESDRGERRYAEQEPNKRACGGCGALQSYKEVSADAGKDEG